MNLGKITVSTITTTVRPLNWSPQCQGCNSDSFDTQATLRALPAPVQLRINQLAEKNIWHRDCDRQRYMDANHELSVISKIFSDRS